MIDNIMDARNVLRKFSEKSAMIVASIYLTFIVDVYTLNTWPKRIFVFCYFLIMCHAVRFLKKKVQGEKTFPWHMSIAIGILAVAIVVLGHSIFFPTARETTISLVAVPCEDGNYHEVWFTTLRIDGQELQLSQLSPDANHGWTYSGDNDDYVFYPLESADNANYLTFEATGKEFELTFAENSWSGTVDVQANGDTERLILTSTDDSNDIVQQSFTAERTYRLWEKLLYGAGAWLLVMFLLEVLLSWCMKHNDSLSREQYKKLIIGLLTLINTGFLFFTDAKIQPTRITRVILLCMTLIAILILNMKSSEELLKKYRTRSGRAGISIISIYASLVSFAQRFFLNGNTRIHGSLTGILYCISGVLWFVPIVCMMLFALERCSMFQHSTEPRINRRKAKSLIFGVLAVCNLTLVAVLWPGGFPADAIDQLNQAIGSYALNDWHPVLHTLIERMIINIFPAAGAIIVIQMLLFAMLVTAFLMIGYDNGMRVSTLLVIGVVLVCLPNQVLSFSNSLKDFPYTLALLWGMYLLYQIALQTPQIHSIRFYVALAVDLFLIMTLRHNGIVPFVCIAAMLIVITVRYRKSLGLQSISSVVLAFFMVMLYKGPIFSVLNVQRNPVSPYTTMLCAVGSCVNKGLPLSDETNQILTRVMPLEDWAEYYNRYVGHDDYFWGRPEGSVPYDTSSVSSEDAFRIYLEALRKYPDVVIKDRLDGMDIMWNVTQPEDGFNAKSFDFINPFNEEVAYLFDADIDPNVGKQLYENNFIAKCYHKSMEFPINDIADMLLWRTGAYLITLLVLILFWWKNHMHRLWWISMPIIGNIAGSLLVLYHQSFRYVYFIQLGVIALIFITILIKNDSKDKMQRKNL